MNDVSTVAENPAQTELLPNSTPVTENPVPTNEPETTPADSTVKSPNKIRALLSKHVEKFGFKKGAGRPKKCRACDGAAGGCSACNFTGFEKGKGDMAVETGPITTKTVSKPVEPVSSPAPVAAAPLGDSIRAAAFRRAVAAAIKGIVRLCTSLTRVRAAQAGLEKDFIDAAIKEGLPQKEQVDDFANSLDAVLKKHGVEPDNCEEWTLAIDGLNLFSGFPAMFAMFKEEIERKKQLELKKAA